ncbi:MAG: ABC transporter permease [Candidatus Didemnitutus sp.]|nr:ABC transporter permease [Candidatus Didemnitutus sp.]
MDLLASALRALRAHKLFSVLIIGLLALGIGANTAIFSVVHAVLLKPLPYPQPGELVLVRKPPRDASLNLPGGGDQMPDNEFLGWTEAVPKTFRALAAYRNSSSALQRGDGAVRVPTAAVTGEFFPMLGVSAWRGRLFDAADLKPGAPLTAVLSYSAWQSRFEGKDSALGEVVMLDDAPHTIVGVLPPAFEFTDPVQFWRPLQLTPSAPGQLRIQMVRVFGRLMPGTKHETAQRELDEISDRFWTTLATGFVDGGPNADRRAAPPTAAAPANATSAPAAANSGAERAAAPASPAPDATPSLPRGVSLQLPPGANPNNPAVQKAIADALAQRQAAGGSQTTVATPRADMPTSGVVAAPASAPSNSANPTPAADERRLGPAGVPPAGGPPRLQLPFVGSKAQLVTLQEQLARQSRATLWLLLCAVGFVLLIACANIANLQLARAATRRRDVAVRAALGASPGRLAAEVLAENLVLALLGGLAGTALAWASSQVLQRWLADYLPRVNPVGVNLTVLAFALLLAFVAGLAFGLAPAWQGARVDLLDTLKEGCAQASRGGSRWRQALVALEFALALVLAINTGLLIRSIYQLYSTDLGFRVSDVLTANLSLPRRYSTPAQQRDFARRWLENIRALPGVKSAAITDLPPLSPYSQIVLSATVQGGTGNANASVNSAPQQMAITSVTPDFFPATGIALRQGRLFTEQDGADAPPVALVNEAFVKQYYPKGLTLGAQLAVPGLGGPGSGPPSRNRPPPTAAIVGVVADVRPRGFESAAQPLAYFPFEQQPRARISAVVQFTGDAATLSRLVTQATHKIDAGLALDHPSTLEAQLNRQNAPRRITLFLTSAFAATAVLLAALGIFGVMSYTVTLRTQEIGVRMALGADTATILRWMLRYGAVAIAGGLAAGLGLTVATSRLLSSFLVGITALDPLVVTCGVVALVLVGLIACWLPARRATQVNPVEALRNE